MCDVIIACIVVISMITTVSGFLFPYFPSKCVYQSCDGRATSSFVGLRLFRLYGGEGGDVREALYRIVPKVRWRWWGSSSMGGRGRRGLERRRDGRRGGYGSSVDIGVSDTF